MLHLLKGSVKIMPNAALETRESSVSIEALRLEALKVQEMLRKLLYETGELIAKTQRLIKELERNDRGVQTR